jgi:hypothetical protein
VADSLIFRVLRRIGRAAQPLFDPSAEERRKRDERTRKSLDELEDSVARVGAQVDGMSERIDKATRREILQLQDAVSTLRWSTRRQMAFADRLLHAANSDRQHEFGRERAVRRLRNLDRGRGPVLVGPWTGEVGFELLYWVPFVRWAVERFGIDPARITIVSRGGTASWYGLAGARYIDILDRRPAEELRAHMAEKIKQRTLRSFDRRLIRELAGEGEGRASVLHPALMYALYMPFWKQVTSIRWVDQYSRPTRITAPAVPLKLPKNYVAVRFYFSRCFPDTPENRELVQSIVAGIARDRDVVVLGSGVYVDDHLDATAAGSGPRIHTIEDVVTPSTNLAVQTAAIAGAAAFIGTYGGFSYLAPLCGVNSVALYSVRNYYPHHLDFAQRMFAQVGGGSLTTIDTSVRDLVAQLAQREVLR